MYILVEDISGTNELLVGRVFPLQEHLSVVSLTILTQGTFAKHVKCRDHTGCVCIQMKTS